MSFARRNARTLLAAAGAAALTALLTVATAASAGGDGRDGGRPVEVEVLAPEPGDRAGLGCRGWFVDLAVEFGNVPLERTGFTGLQLTGPGAHNNAQPFPGAFSPGQDDRFRGLIVLVSTAAAGPGTNVANLFNLTGVTDRDGNDVEIWDTWIVGAPNFGCNTGSTLYAAIAADRNGNGVYDDAPNVVPDADGDGDVDTADLTAFGVASNIERVDFSIVG